MSGDVPRSSQRAAFWSMKTNPLSAGTRSGRRGFCQTLGVPISRDQALTDYPVHGENFPGIAKDTAPPLSTQLYEATPFMLEMAAGGAL